MLASLAVTFGSESIDFDSAGAIGCIAVGATAVKHWRDDAAKHVSSAYIHARLA